VYFKGFDVKYEYREDPEVRKAFDEGMTELFHASKRPLKQEKPKSDAMPTNGSNH
jgi:hypothetical protein